MDKDELKTVIEKLLQAIEKAEEPTLDMFAAHAMQGLMATQYALGAPCDREVAPWSYKVAKEMMEERKKWIK